MAPALSVEVSDLQYEIEKIRTPCAHGTGSFVPEQALRSYLKKPRVLDDLLDALKIDRTYFNGIRHNCLLVFALLIRLNKANEIPKFVRDRHLFDDRLPFHKKDKSKWPEDCQDFFDRFYAEQWQFCVEKWEEGKLNGREFDSDALFPILTKEVLRNGTNSQTYKIELCAEYNGLGTPTNILVLKTCSRRDGRHHHNEVSTYQHLMQLSEVSPNIVLLYGYFQHSDTLNLVLEYANGGTLEQLFQSELLPQSPAESLEFWTNFTKVFNPLFKMHELKYRNITFKGTHQDIKPANILISRHDELSNYNMVFKLIDFAFTHFQLWSKDSDASDFDEGGTQMYCAPELCRSDRFLQHSILTVDTNIDTWSFGAVLSETLVWCALGKEGLQTYRERRRQATKGNILLDKGGYEGCFHDGSTVLTVVHQMHMQALDAVRDDVYTNGILRELVGWAESMLVEADSRPKDLVIYRAFDSAIRRARDLLVPHTAPEEQLQMAQDAIPAAFQIRDSSRLLPPELPPDPLLAGTQHGQPSEPLTARPPSITVNRDDEISVMPQAAISQNRSILRNPSQNGSADDRYRMKRRITFRERAENIPPVTPTRPQQVHSNDRYPDVTITKGHEWVKNLKELLHNSKMAAPSILPSLPGPDYKTRLNDRDQIFLFDDSLSMGSHWMSWNGVIRTFEVLGYLVKTCSQNGLKAYTTNSRQWKRSKERADIVRMLRNTNPAGICNMRHCLLSVIQEWWAENRSCLEKGFEKNRSHKLSIRPAPKKKRGLNVYVITDGVWQNNPPGSFCGVDLAIKEIFDKMMDHNVDSETIGIEFVRVGNDAMGSRRLELLAERVRSLGVTEDIVHTEPSSGNIWKMLLGSTDRGSDNDVQEGSDVRILGDITEEG